MRKCRAVEVPFSGCSSNSPKKWSVCLKPTSFISRNYKTIQFCTLQSNKIGFGTCVPPVGKANGQQYIDERFAFGMRVVHRRFVVNVLVKNCSQCGYKLSCSHTTSGLQCQYKCREGVVAQVESVSTSTLLCQYKGACADVMQSNRIGFAIPQVHRKQTKVLLILCARVYRRHATQRLASF